LRLPERKASTAQHFKRPLALGKAYGRPVEAIGAHARQKGIAEITSELMNQAKYSWEGGAGEPSPAVREAGPPHVGETGSNCAGVGVYHRA
jgi:hypothetical protein